MHCNHLELHPGNLSFYGEPIRTYSIDFQIILFTLLPVQCQVTLLSGLRGTDKRGSFYRAFGAHEVWLYSLPLHFLMLIPPLQQPDAPLLWRTLTKLREVRDFHMEKAINSSLPQGTERERHEGNEDVWRYKQAREVWGRKRAWRGKMLVSHLKQWGETVKLSKGLAFLEGMYITCRLSCTVLNCERLLLKCWHWSYVGQTCTISCDLVMYWVM